MLLYTSTRSNFKHSGIVIIDGRFNRRTKNFRADIFKVILAKGNHGGVGKKSHLYSTHLTHLTPMMVQKGYATHGWRRVRRVRRVGLRFSWGRAKPLLSQPHVSLIVCALHFTMNQALQLPSPHHEYHLRTKTCGLALLLN